MKKFIAASLMALSLLAVEATTANAVVCARGPYRAGCAGPNGAVGVHRGYGYHGGAAVMRRPAYGVHRGYYGGVRRY
jgi:hypothetical protein